MKKRHIALILFVILGISDFAYGIWWGDQFSLLMGCLIVVVAAGIAWKERRESGA
jgi:hypothetical protein